MRVPRIFHPEPLLEHQLIELSDDAANHVGRVLRLEEQHPLVLFCGDGYNYDAQIQQLQKKKVIVQIGVKQSNTAVESPLSIHLGQVISRGDKMDFTLQKSVELGVNEITPLFSKRCGVKLNAERLEKKQIQWQKIVISACEQCGRSIVPKVNAVMPLEQWIEQATLEMKLNLHPLAPYTIKSMPKPEHGIRLLIGPEGGLSAEEISQCSLHDFSEIQLGPRILRTETAALTAITALQCQFGDLA
ncbi:16S rRNA (uracil(1498)-N(3))-methyltransferase [Celerinatantimonas sp. YJH-8]|uniref:16S rRNA (uracil(1498)-N(3))-methyltransferase n=1 Tax=Celerinatantimonas sp. YJH-8 TaxID=3228714 RepID=UPI0038C0F7B3